MTTVETTVSHPFRYGSVTRRVGTRGESFQARIRRQDNGKWKTVTTHTYEEAEAILKAWNEERESAVRAFAASRR